MVVGARVHARGDWGTADVASSPVVSTHALPAALAARVESLWAEALAVPGRLLFDGPMTRLESWTAAPASFTFTYSTTSYKAFHILHQAHPELLREFPPAAVNPLGISVLIVSDNGDSLGDSLDGDLLVGQRSTRVAYHPGRIHPFAGGLEPKDSGDLFTAAYREAHEELGLTRDEVATARLIGLVQDPAIMQPEAVLLFNARLTTSQIRARLDPTEHDGLLAFPATRASLDQVLATESLLTPVCAAAISLYVERLSQP